MTYLKKSTNSFPQLLNSESVHRKNKEVYTSEQPLQEVTKMPPNTPLSASHEMSMTSPKEKNNHLNMMSLKCFVCSRIIKSSHLSEHLIIGEVNCEKCNVSFKDCQSFQLWYVEYHLGNSSCEHVLRYSTDPLHSLDLHLSNQYLENGTSSRASLIDRPGHLKAYVNGMKSLKNKLPWHQAVERFKTYSSDKNRKRKKTTQSTDKKNEEPFDSNGHLNHSPEVNSNSSSINAEPEKIVSVYDFSEDTNGSPAERLHSISIETSMGISNGQKNSQASPSKMINGFSDGSPKKRKEVKRRRKSEWISGFTRNTKKKSNGIKQNDSAGYVETPINGFYYVVTHAVSECPNCYAKISPPDFTVNIVTFLMTAVCNDCGLTIYIVHDPPDDSTPRVCIVAGDNRNDSQTKKKRKRISKASMV